MPKKKRNRTIAERVNYHTKRLNSAKATENQKIYSRNWLDGFYDRHADVNYSAVCSEISAKKGRMSRAYSINLHAYRNGAKAQLDNKK